MNLRKLALTALLSAPLLASAANLVTNGDFENSTPGTAWSNSATSGFAPISAYGPCCAPYGTYTGGNNASFFGWGDLPGGSIWQDLATVNGQNYTVSFEYGAISAPTLQTMQVSALSGPTFATMLGATNLKAIGTSDLGTLLSSYSFTFTADSALTRLQFTDNSANTFSVDGVVDNVAVMTTPVPEPETYALMLAGLGVMTFVARRRKAA
jgi:PEP-CTERM motif/Protein of unknown function (DUF642)